MADSRLDENGTNVGSEGSIVDRALISEKVIQRQD